VDITYLAQKLPICHFSLSVKPTQYCCQNVYAYYELPLDEQQSGDNSQNCFSPSFLPLIENMFLVM
jgi:hypothetical protein